MPDLPITSLFAGIACIVLVLISLPISLRRRKLRQALGDGGDAGLHRLIRAQGNFTEYVPLALIGVGLVELCGYAPAVVWSIGGPLALGRLLHMFGTWRTSTPLRALAMLMTFASLLSSGGLLLAAAAPALLA